MQSKGMSNYDHTHVFVCFLMCQLIIQLIIYIKMKKYAASRSYLKPTWTPEVYGPMYGKGSIAMTEALSLRRTNKCTRIMATFVPNQIVQAKDLVEKTIEEYDGILLLLDISNFSILYKKYSNSENGGSYAFSIVLDKYLNVIVEEVYSSGGDILKFSQSGILILWRINKKELIMHIIPKVISSAFRLKNLVEEIPEGKEYMGKITIVISAGKVIFGIIGNEVSRHYILIGKPIVQLKNAKKACLPGDLVLSMSAWKHCSSSRYEYVIKDSQNIKIIRALQDEKHKLEPSIRPLLSSIATEWDRKTLRRFSEMLQKRSINLTKKGSSSSDEDSQGDIHRARNLVVDAIKQKLGAKLKLYLLNPIADQIIQDLSLEHIMERRRLTMIYINIIPTDCTNYELIFLIDDFYLLLYDTIDKYSASIYVTNLYDKDILFSIAFGLAEMEGSGGETTRNGITCAFKILKALKSKSGVHGVSIGVSTGMVYCGVVGHIARREYLIIGTPVDKALRMMEISYDKVTCDYDTIMHSHLYRSRFRSRGIKEFPKIGKYHVYEFLGVPSVQELRENVSSVYYRYPILGREHELDTFNDILDNIGVLDREFSGMVIMGNERSGKSRLLDAFVTRAENWQISVIKLPLLHFYIEKDYTVIYHILLQIFDAEDCKSIKDRERAVYKKMRGSLVPCEYCYLNIMMKVGFPLSKEFCADNDWTRHTKRMQIFNVILNQCGKICIFLDDFHYTDSISCQFVSLALNNANVVTVITFQNPAPDITFDVAENLLKDKRLIKKTVQGLDNELLTPFACQFLNVVAIPRSVDVILKKHSNNEIGWCEAFLSLILQNNGLEFRTMTAAEITHYNLVFSKSSMVMKVPADLLPEDVVPSKEINSYPICITNAKYLGFAYINLDFDGLKKAIYKGMNSYEQQFLKCASAIGRFFVRAIVQTVMLNSTAVYTAKTVAEMIRIRVVECASIQRGTFYTDDHLYGILKRRMTFSNMHHLVYCDCHSFHDFNVPSLPAYSNCKMLEFKILSFHKMLHDMLTVEERNEYRHMACMIYEREAQKCAECGSGSFLKIFSRPTAEMVQANPDAKEFLMRKPRRSILKTSHQKGTRLSKAPTPRISIMPTVDDKSGDEDEEDLSSDVISVSSKIGYLYDRSRSKLLRRSSITPEGVTDPSRSILLKKFTSIDFRNCHCYDKINCIFWQMNQYLDQLGSDENILELLFAYSAGLIETAEPQYALKILQVANERNDIFQNKCQRGEKCNENPIANKGLIFVLMGEAYMALGYYEDAKNMYQQAVSLRAKLPKSKLSICYNLIVEKIRLRLAGTYPNYFINRHHGPTAHDRLELASYLRRYSTCLVTKAELKTAKMIILHTLRIGFESAGNFLEHGEIYLAAVKIFRRAGDLRFIRHLERPMIEIMKKKIYWCRVEELTTTTNIFLAMYENRALRGEFGGAIEYGRKILRISDTIHLSHVKLSLLPSLIEIMMWTKHLSEAIDLMNELYFLSDEDIDSSAITWYYALSLEFLLDAGIFVESYESCLHHAEILGACKAKCCVSRDPESHARLLTGLWIWQLRMGYMIDEKLKLSSDTYTKNVTYDNFSKIFNCSKGLECFLLVLVRCINLKKSSELTDALDSVHTIIKKLNRVSSYAKFIKPRFYFLKFYMGVIRGQKSTKIFNLSNAEKWSNLQNNGSMIAWIIQNKRAMTITNLGQYWIENVAYTTTIHWQDIQEFDLRGWATVLYPLPNPDKCL